MFSLPGPDIKLSNLAAWTRLSRTDIPAWHETRRSSLGRGYKLAPLLIHGVIWDIVVRINDMQINRGWEFESQAIASSRDRSKRPMSIP